MPTYIEKTTNSDLSPSWLNTTAFDKVMSVGTGVDTFVTVNGMAGVVETGSFISLAGVPNNDAWEAGGTQTVEIEVDVTSVDIDVRVRLVRLSSTGTILEQGLFTAPQDLGATRTFSPAAPSPWLSAENCDNRIAIELEISYNPAHGSATADIGLGTVANEVITDITEDSAGCTGAAADVAESGTVGNMLFSLLLAPVMVPVFLYQYLSGLKFLQKKKKRSILKIHQLVK